MLTVVVLLAIYGLAGGQQHLPPGVPPQHYQQHQPQMQQMPPQHMQQQQQQQQHHIPQHMPVQQQQMHMPQQQQIHIPQQQQMHQQHHGHHGPPQVLNVANINQEKEHIAEHLSVPMDTSKMSEQELQFHYFKMHDADNNNKLDGCELIKSLIHWHGENSENDKPIHSDEFLSEMVDELLKTGDSNNDGFISYTEFKTFG